jgi:hypothetical protein
MLLLLIRIIAQSKLGVYSPGLGAYSKNESDVFSFNLNQGSLVNQESLSAGIYAERPYMLQQLKNVVVGICLPTSLGNFGLATSGFGNAAYSQSSFGLAYARSMGSRINLGVQFNFNSIRVNGYGNSSTITADAGLLIHFSEKFHGGLQFKNPAGGRFGDEKYPTVISFGIGYEASKSFFITTVIIKEEGKPPNVSTGFQYRVHSNVFARLGFSGDNASPWASVHYLFKQFQLGCSFSMHQRLGITPGLQITYNFKTENQKTKEE